MLSSALPVSVSLPSPVAAFSMTVPPAMVNQPTPLTVAPVARLSTTFPVTAAASIQSMPPLVSARIARPLSPASAAIARNSSV